MADVDKVVAALFGLLGVVHLLTQLAWIPDRRVRGRQAATGRAGLKRRAGTARHAR